jgi:hypothetical protein
VSKRVLLKVISVSPERRKAVDEKRTELAKAPGGDRPRVDHRRRITPPYFPSP